MRNLEIQFSYPWSAWLLLLLIPAILLTLLPYFRLSKRYRRTRNRITSIVLHLIVMTLAIFALSGMTFHYQEPNEENEVIFLVDVSDSEVESQEEINDFILEALSFGQYDNFKVGVVTFGFDQQYAVPLTYEIDKVYDRYLEAALPDVSATNIADALTYTKDLFSNPQSAKIVLITDAKETDKKALNVIRAVAAQGTKVDTVHIGASSAETEVQIVGVEFPEFHINKGDDVTISLTVRSNTETALTVEMLDNGTPNSGGSVTLDTNASTQIVSLAHVFTEEGLHELTFKLTGIGDDGLEENNEYYSYYYLELFNNILIIEREEGDSELLITALNDQDAYAIDVQAYTSAELPKTIDALREYDQVILNNISNEELTSIPIYIPENAKKDDPKDFSELLEIYVREYGGGLFTAGGNDEDGNANAYNREDMYGTVYQQMLPVQAINYTPPVGVVVIIDRSSSMGGSDDYGESKLDHAKAGASACLQALSERDYIGIMTLDSEPEIILEMTPRTQEAKILEAINNGIDEPTGGTQFSNAIRDAGTMLRALTNVDKRHIVIVTDGQPADKLEEYGPIIENLCKDGLITLSIVGIDMAQGSSAYNAMTQAVELGNGRLIIASSDELVWKMKEELNAPEIEEINYEPFYPVINNVISNLLKGVEHGEGENRNRLTVSLDGFYGVKVRSSDEVDLVLKGEYDVPIYAQWKYGNGTVGSFMCDLNGTWSGSFLTDPNGQQFLKNVVNGLMPTQDIQPQDMSIELEEDNYTNQLTVKTDLNDGEYVEAKIFDLASGDTTGVSLNVLAEGLTQEDRRNLSCYVTAPLNADNRYTRCSFVVKVGGVYRIELRKLDAEGNVLATLETYKAFAYSEEYDMLADVDEALLAEELDLLATRGGGKSISFTEDEEGRIWNAWEVFEDFITASERTFDPRFLFMILAIVLFLLDIAVRKFKFKWPHELIREYKEKKNSKQ